MFGRHSVVAWHAHMVSRHIPNRFDRHFKEGGTLSSPLRDGVRRRNYLLHHQTIGRLILARRSLQYVWRKQSPHLFGVEMKIMQKMHAVPASQGFLRIAIGLGCSLGVRYITT